MYASIRVLHSFGIIHSYIGVRKSHFFMQDKSCYKLAKNYVLWNNDPFQLL